MKSKQSKECLDDDFVLLEDQEPQVSLRDKMAEFFPSEKRKFWRSEAVELRKCFTVLLPIHVLLVLSDVFVFNFEIAAVLFDLLFVWFSYYNYMLLKKLYVGIQAGLYLVGTLIAMSHLKRVLTDVETWAPTIVYFVQYYMLYPFSAAIIAKRLQVHYNQQKELKKEKNNKTFKKRIKMKLNKKAEAELKPIAIRRVKTMLSDPSDDE